MRKIIKAVLILALVLYSITAYPLLVKSFACDGKALWWCIRDAGLVWKSNEALLYIFFLHGIFVIYLFGWGIPGYYFYWWRVQNVKNKKRTGITANSAYSQNKDTFDFIDNMLEGEVNETHNLWA